MEGSFNIIKLGAPVPVPAVPADASGAEDRPGEAGMLRKSWPGNRKSVGDVCLYLWRRRRRRKKWSFFFFFALLSVMFNRDKKVFFDRTKC